MMVLIYGVILVVSRSSNTIRVQLQVIQYVFQIKILSKDTPSFQREDSENKF